jgi:uncharacterized protein YcnI
MRLALALSCAVVAMPLFTSRAAAHISPEPSFLAAESTGTIELNGHNDRSEPMTGFAVQVPGDFRLLDAEEVSGWRTEVGGSRATWRDGSLAGNTGETFSVVLQAPSAPGPATLDVEQIYAGGDVLRWPVPLTITPADESSSQNIGWALVTGVLGLALFGAIGYLFLRRSRPVRER